MIARTGKLRLREKVHGDLNQHPPDLQASVRKIPTPTAKIKKPLGIVARPYRVGMACRAVAHVLDAIFRFLKATDIFTARHNAKAGTAPAVLVDVETEVKASKAAPLSHHPAELMHIDQAERLVVSPHLNAYNRAAAVFHVKLFLERLSRAIPAMGAIAKYRKAVPLESIYQAEAAESAILEGRFVKIFADPSAMVSQAPAEEIAVDLVLAEACEVDADTAPAEEIVANRGTTFARSAVLHSWGSAFVVDGVLILRYAHSVYQVGDTLRIDDWLNPVCHSDVLTLIQVSEATLNDNTLEVA